MLTDTIKKLTLLSSNNIPFKAWEAGDRIGENYIVSKRCFNRIEKIRIYIDTDIKPTDKTLYITIINSTDKEYKFFSNCTYLAEEF